MYQFDADRFDNDDLRLFDSLRKEKEQEKRFGPCEDDYESTCPYVDLLPEESSSEEGSPLSFASSFDTHWKEEIDQQIEHAMKVGW
jgi:hypothetical protein